MKKLIFSFFVLFFLSPFSVFAAAKVDESGAVNDCRNSEYDDERDECLQNLAYVKNDFSICNLLEDESGLGITSCMERLAEKNNNIDLCDKLVLNQDKTVYNSNTKTNVDATIFFRSRCAKEFVLSANQISYCSRVSDAWWREQCYKDLKKLEIENKLNSGFPYFLFIISFILSLISLATRSGLLRLFSISEIIFFPITLGLLFLLYKFGMDLGSFNSFIFYYVLVSLALICVNLKKSFNYWENGLVNEFKKHFLYGCLFAAIYLIALWVYISTTVGFAAIFLIPVSMIFTVYLLSVYTAGKPTPRWFLWSSVVAAVLFGLLGIGLFLFSLTLKM